MSDKKKRQMGILLGVFAVLLICFLGIQMWNKKQDEKKTEEEQANKIYMTDISDVTAVTYNGGTDTMSFQKNEDGDWYVAADEAFPLNPDTVERIVDTYSRLEADRKLTEGDDISAYGLDAPTYYVALTDSAGNETIINIGNSAEDDYYAMVDGEETVYTIPASNLEDMQTALSDMAQLDTFPSIGSGNIVSEVIQTGDSTTTYKASNDDDSEAVAAVVGGLSVISLDTPVDYHMADADAAKYGLDEENKTTVTVTYTDDDEKEQTAVLYLGNEDDSGNRYVQMDGSKIVYTVTVEICNNILNIADDTDEAAE
ncbi:MAG: DUF4340 domain-containing protein [Hespellia sp.]|nr:DUF4340 domain-containing protein [Hespellia sp.]